jgi:hypothetical protein
MTLLSQQWCDVGIAAGNDKADACAAANRTPAACTTMGSKKGTARLSLGPSPCCCRFWRQSSIGCSVMACVPWKISLLMMKAIAVM